MGLEQKIPYEEAWIACFREVYWPRLAISLGREFNLICSFVSRHMTVEVVGLLLSFTITIFVFCLMAGGDRVTTSALRALKEGRGIGILFVPLSGGFGHLSRCAALAREIKRNDPSARVMFVASSLTYEAAVKEGLPVLRVPEEVPSSLLDRWFRVAGERASRRTFTMAQSVILSLWITFFLKGLQRWLKTWSITRRFRPDVIVADGEFLMPIFCKAHKIPFVYISNDPIPTVPRLIGEGKADFAQRIVDKLLVKFMGWSRMVIVPDSADTVSVPKDLDGRVVFTGPILKRRLEELPDRETARRRLNIRRDDLVILVTVSGVGNDSGLVSTAVRAFEKIRTEEPRAKMIVKYWPAISDEEAAKIRGAEGLRMVDFVPDMFDYMTASDVTVTHGGHTTLMEGTMVGAAIITVPMPGQAEQEANARRMAAEGRAIAIPASELTAEMLASTIVFLLRDDQKRSKMASMNRKHASEEGVVKAAELILSL